MNKAKPSSVVVNFLAQVNFCFSFVFVYSANKVETKGKKLTGDKKIVENTVDYFKQFF